MKSSWTVNQTVIAATLLAASLAAPAGAEPPPRLDARIEEILQRAGLADSKTSIRIVRLPNGEPLYERNPAQLLNPASNVKIVTAAAALASLGPDYTFKTEFYSKGPIRKGRIGPLWIKGTGDPVFVTEELDSLADHLRARGLERIEGDLYVDEGAFGRGHRVLYLSEINDHLYEVVTGPLSFNFNTREIEMRSKRRRWVRREPVEDAALFTGTSIREALETRGIVITGGLKRGAVPPNAFPIWIHSSPPLSEILKGMGKFSNNFIAEQLVQTMGAVRFGPPGTTAKGLAVMAEYLARLGFPPEGHRIENGSGLSKGSLLSASQLVTVLTDLYLSPSREIFLSSLSVAGIDGTLKKRWRHSPLKGQIFAKTGSLAGVQTLSGYLRKKGRWVAFSLLFNDNPVSADQVVKVEEEILTAVAESL